MQAIEMVQMVYDIRDLNNEVGKNVYLLIVDDILVGSTRKSDINNYLADTESLLALDNYVEEDTLFLYGLVLDIRKLPYELPKELKDNGIWIFQEPPGKDLAGSVTHEVVPDMKEATKIIEQTIASEHVDINDFAIVVGREMGLIIQIEPGTFKIDGRYIF